MARFLENKNNIKKPAQKKKKKKQENPSTQERINQKSYGTTKPNVKVNTTRTANTVGNTNGKYQAGSNNNTQQRYNNRPQGTATRTRSTPATAGGSQYGRAGTNARRSASEGFQRDMQARQAESRQRNQKLKEDQERRRQESEARRSKMSASRNPRMQDTARSTRLQTEEERRQKQDRLREAQRQKMGDNSMASESAQRAANRAVRNTPTVVKESLKQTAIGHGKTAADLTELNKSAAIGSKIDIKSKEFQEDIEKRRKQSTRVAGTAFNELSKMQEKSEDRMQKVTGNAKGLEKAYYGALESGTGMALDRALGPAWAVSMLSRTYGNTRGQAKKEGATEAEDRAYSLLQGAKEVATEYLFQGVGLAKGLSGRASLAPSEKVAKYATRNMSGRAADLAHAGIRLLGGTAEENAEEIIGWGLDPFIKEFTYKKNVRSRQAQQMMREQSDSLRSNITSPQEAQAMAAYLGSDDFLEQQTRTYMDSGIGEAEARDLAEQMRDYLDASLSGDTGRMADIEESLSNKLAGKGSMQSIKEEYSLSELMDTVASTTLLTATTGLPGAFTTASKGAAIRDQLGDNGIRALAKTAEDFEDKEMQLKAKAMSDRLASGKDITSTQAYDLAVGVQEQYNKDSDRQQAAYQTANKTIKREKLVTPYSVSRNGDIDMDEVTDKTYQTTAKSAKDIIRGYAESDESTESLTDTEIDRGSRAIAGFQTGVFTVDDANELNVHNTAVRSAFQAETGIDLNQYVVKQKNGEIDIPATNAATKDALFAMAADNLVKSAQAETANWMDNAKGEVVTQISRRMGAKGTEALQVALDDVDERDRTSYMMTANATDMLYQAARNMGTDWDSAKKYAQRMFPSISEEKLKAMYDAGLEDRIAATDNAVGLQIEIGKKAEIKAGAEKAPMGQLLIETDVPVKGTVARTFTELAKNLGVDIHLVDHFTDENGNVLKNVNGEYIDGNIYINVNSDFEKNMGFIFMHEVTHHLKKFAPEQYHELENLVRDKWFNYDAAQMQSAIAKKIETYAKHGQKLTEEQALEEIIADASHEFLTDPKFAREVADADASLAQAVLTSIRNALRALRRIMSSGNVSDDTHMNTLFSQLDILDEAERIWLSAYTQAVKNNAAVEVDRLQNQIYEEGRQSISETSDADYMDAVEEYQRLYDAEDIGFLKAEQKLQRMVDNAAIQNGYSLKAYHGTNSEPFNVFDRNHIAHGRMYGDGFYFSPYEEVAGQYGQDVREYYLKTGRLTEKELGSDTFAATEYKEFDSLDEAKAFFREKLSQFNKYGQGIERFRPEARKKGGKPGVRYTTVGAFDNGLIMVATEPEYIKSTDPITYDDNGDVIPLSERFNQSSPDIRYSIADTDSEGNAITEQEATVLHDIGPDVRFSMTTENEPQAKAAFRAGKGEYRGYKFEMSGRELRTKLIKENFPEDQADAIVKAIDSFMDATGEFLTDKDGLRLKYQFIGWDDLESGTVSVRRDKNGKIRSVNFSAMKKNDEYPVNFDFSTVCNKRISFTKVIEEIAKAHDAETGASVFSEIKLTPDNMWKINEALKAEGIDTACLGCFVESRRYHIDTFFQNVEDRWNKPVREARKKLGLPEEEYFNFSKEEVPGEQWSAADDNWGDYGRAKAFKGAPLARTQVLMNEIVKAGDVDSPLLKLIRPSDLLTPEGFEGFRKLSNAKIDMVGQIKSMYGAGVPKEILGFTPYNSEIALLPKNYKKTKMEKYLKSIGGIRIQSFSDFMIEHVYDHFQLIADAAYRKLPIHAYTKVIAYAKIFGLTGAKINMSVMFDVKNSKQWAEDLGISEADAKQYADKYQGLRFVTETPAEYKTAYENASTDEKLKKKYDKYISEGATEEEARRKTADWAVRPFRPITLEGKKGYLTYLVSDADYVNEQYQRMYNQYISEGLSEAEAERKANSNKPFEQSINYREAKALQDQDGYRENVGIIGVAFGDEHLRMMMDDENVRYIIPYHSSNLPVVVSNKTNLKVARDYSDRQNTYKAESWTIDGKTYNDLKSAYAEFKKNNKGEAHPARAFFADAFSKNLDAKFGDKVEGSNTGAFDVYKSLDTAKEISDVSERYLEDCIENNYIPVFHEFASSPGYYKMLFDFMVADDNGSLYPQHEVRNNYPGVDVDAKAEAGEAVTDSDLTELKKVIEEGAKAQNDKLQKWQDRKGNVMQDLLSREGEHSIIADSNINSVRYGTEDYTNPKTGEGIPKDAKLSISEDLDEPYMTAVNAGNMEEAQKYVDEAAKRAGYKTRLYHGTRSFGFTQIRTTDLESKSDGGFFEWSPFFASDSLEVAQTYSSSEDIKRISEAVEPFDEEQFENEYADAINDLVGAINGFAEVYNYMDYSVNPFASALKELQTTSHPADDIADDLIDNVSDIISELAWSRANDIVEANPDENRDVDDLADEIQEGPEANTIWVKLDIVTDMLRSYDAEVYGNASSGNYDLLTNTDNMMTVDAKGHRWNDIPFDAIPEKRGYYKTRQLAEIARDEGYAGIAISNLFDDGGQGKGKRQTKPATIYIFFNPERQVKSADTVTYAEDGSVIPLSERFDPTNNDIRYSMSTEDANGNVLTNGQMEYFKNSQARDEQGRLVPVYHATSMGGFTIFDPSYSDDRRSLFFSNKRDVAQTYVEKHLYTDEDRLGDGGINIDSWERLVDYARDLYMNAGLDWEYDSEFESLGWILYTKDEKEYMADLDEWGDTYDDAYAKWAEMAKRNDPEADKYRISIRLPYEDKSGDIDYKKYVADSVAELLEKVSADPVPQAGYYQVYLNLENPLIIEGDGQSWDSIAMGGSVVKANKSFYINTKDSLLRQASDKDDMFGIGQAWSNGDKFREEAEEAGDRIQIDLYGAGKTYVDANSDAVAAVINNYLGLEEDAYLGYEVANDVLGHVEKDGSWRKYYGTDYLRTFTGEETHDTREWAEIAQAEGYDGVIFRNIVDVDSKTEIDEDEALSDIFIAFSSNQVKDTRNENPTENPDIRYSVTEDEAMTYAAENAKTTDDLWYTDPEMESDRVRVANSKMAYIESRITKWNERWLTEGQVLDEKSVKSNIRNLIRGVMANSDTDYQYKTEMVDNAVKAAKKAFYLRKVGKYSEAADLLFDTAQEIYQDNKFYGEDADFQGYKELRDFIRKTKFYVPEDQWRDIDMEAFRRNNFGSILLGSDGVAVDTIWEHMNSRWPEWFSMEVTHPADMMLSVEYALEKAKPIARAYASEEAMSLAAELADDLDTIISEGKEYVSIADTYKKKYDEKTKQMKQRHNEAMRKYRENLQDKYKKRFSEWKKDYKEKQKNKADHRKLFEGIKDDYDWLSKAVLDPTKTKYIPEAFRASLAQLLMQMDLETARSKQLEKKYGRVTSNTLKLRELRDRLNDLATAKAGDDSNLFDIDSYLPYLMDALAEKYDGQPISAMDVDSLKTMKILFKALRKNFTNLNRETEESKANVATKKATKIVLESNAKIDRDGMAKKYEGLRDYMQTINMTSLTPPYFFERMGTVNDLYKELRGGFDTYVRNEAYIMDRLRGILSSYYNKPKGRHPRPGSELEAWRDSRTAKTLELTNGTITMTAAQRMSLYCLTNRKQAMDHMLAGGIVVTPYEAASKIEAAKQGIKGKTEFGERLILSYADTEMIKASLTPEQIKIANELQKLMSEDMARLGNEAHREMYGYEIFGEPNYFPIKSKDTWVPKDVNNMTDAVEKIKSFGPSKPLVVNASNAIVVDDIFSVVADHCNGMNLYNAYLVPISNFMRVYNTTVTLEDGSRRPVREALEQAYGKKAMQYIDNFIRDLNGIKDRNRGGLEDIMNKTIGTAKATAVAGNLRVAAQQPTAYVRAAAEIDWKYLAPFVYVRPEKGVMDEMFEYCPIARWKAWGYYDTYMGRDIEDVMMNNWSIRDKVLSGVYGKLDNMTWAGIWQAVKAEQKAKHPEMDHNSREFLEICGARASEVFDKTQVVDSTFHRSDAMRNKQVAVKLFTAFMSEPTLTLNVLRAAVYNYQELMKAGHKGAARKVLGKAISVLLVQAVFVSVAQALADAWRGKEPGFPWDDDDEEKGESDYFSRFLQNLFHNFIDQLHLENNLYLVKDVKPYADFMMSKAMDYAGLNPFIRTLMGWDQEYLYNQNNLVFAGLENTATGVSQLFKKLEKGEDYDKTKYEIIQKIASGIGTFTGLPFGTIMRDAKPIFDKLFTVVNAADTLELPSTTKTESESDGASEKTEDSGEKKSIFGFHIKSDEEKAADKEEEEINKKIQDIKSKTEGLSQEEKNQKIYSMVTRYMKDHQDGKPMADYIAAGDYWSIGDIGNMYIRAGGDGEYFKEKVFRASKSAMKKTISADNNESQKAAQARIKDYLLTNGMTEQELSDIAYKSYTKKDLQVAFRINDEDAIITEMRALMEAGMTREDIYKVYDNRNRVDLVKYKDAGGKYADRLKSTGTYNWPCNGTITSHFGYRSAGSTNGVGSTNHKGLDIGASMGAPVTASDGGTVVMAKWYGGYGKTVQIQHDDGTITQYSHLSWWEPKVGDVVAQGQEIGKVGSTGNSTGPHLHFGVMKDGHYVDPEDYLNKKS